MRWTYAAVAACVGSLVFAAAAFAAPVRTMEVVVNPPSAGTPSKPKTVGITMRLVTSDTDGYVPDVARHDDIYLDRGLRTNARYFRSCTLAILNDQQRGPDRCPRGSQVGTGTATAYAYGCGRKVRPNEAIRADVAIRLFNGPRGRTLLAHLRSASPQFQQAFPVQYQRASSPFGIKLNFDIPQNIQQPVAGFCAALVDTQLSIPRKSITRRVRRNRRVRRVRVGFLTSTSCPRDNQFKFRNDVILNNGSVDTANLTANATAACS